MVENYQAGRARELGMPQGVGKRYDVEDLNRFYAAADARFQQFFYDQPLEEQRRLANNPIYDQVLTKIWGSTKRGRYEELFPERRLQRHAQEYNEAPHTQEFVTSTWRNLWEVYGKMAEVHVDIPECDRTDDEIRELEARGRMIIYLPPSLATIEGLPQLQRLIPQHDKAGGWRDWAVIDPENASYSRSWVTNFEEQHGWLSVEAAQKLSDEPGYQQQRAVPTQETMSRQTNMRAGELVGQTANTYILGSVFNKLTTGHYFDERNRFDRRYDYPSLLFGSAIHHADSESKHPGMYFVAYGEQGNIWSWCGAIDYSLARTVELPTPLDPNKIVVPEQRFRAINAYKEIYPKSV